MSRVLVAGRWVSASVSNKLQVRSGGAMNDHRPGTVVGRDLYARVQECTRDIVSTKRVCVESLFYSNRIPRAHLVLKLERGKNWGLVFVS